MREALAARQQAKAHLKYLNVATPERQNKVEEQRENATGFQPDRMDMEPEYRVPISVGC